MKYKRSGNDFCNVQLITMLEIMACLLAIVGCSDNTSLSMRQSEVHAPASKSSNASLLQTGRTKQAFVMVSGYNLTKPYEGEYATRRKKILGQLAERNVAGIVYHTMGHTEQTYRDTLSYKDPKWRLGVPSEVEYNQALFADARSLGTKMWLQVRVLQNSVQVDGESSPRFLKADEILGSPMCVFRPMAAPDSERCRHPIPMMAAPHSKS